uniref:Uncharacterized protein n=1 Tax=Rhizophora mucronata TaxID=61149 RepID=A0A2P2IP30_RHIMU
MYRSYLLKDGHGTKIMLSPSHISMKESIHDDTVHVHIPISKSMQDNIEGYIGCWFINHRKRHEEQQYILDQGDLQTHSNASIEKLCQIQGCSWCHQYIHFQTFSLFPLHMSVCNKMRSLDVNRRKHGMINC